MAYSPVPYEILGFCTEVLYSNHLIFQMSKIRPKRCSHLAKVTQAVRSRIRT